MKKVLLTVAALAISTSALAGPRWTYGDLSYIRGDSGNEDTEGYAVRGSYGFADKWHVRGEYSDVEIDGGAGSSFFGADADGYNLVVGINPAITDSTDFVFELSYFDTSLDTGSGDDDSDGFGLGVGLRSMLADNLEISGSVWSLSGSMDNGTSPSTDFTDIVVVAGGQYYFTDNVGLGIDVNVGDGNSANWYVRWTF